MKTICDFISENINTNIQFTIQQDDMFRLTDEVDAYDNGIDFMLDIKNNKVVSVKFKSIDIDDWKEIKLV